MTGYTLEDLPKQCEKRFKLQKERDEKSRELEALDKKIAALLEQEKEIINYYSKAKIKLAVCGKNVCKPCKVSISPCEHCGKTFGTQKLRVLHMKNCREEVIVPFTATNPKEDKDFIDNIGFVSSSRIAL